MTPMKRAGSKHHVAVLFVVLCWCCVWIVEREWSLFVFPVGSDSIVKEKKEDSTDEKVCPRPEGTIDALAIDRWKERMNE